MIEPRTWFNENGAKLCDRWRDSDRPLAATIIQFGAFTALLALGVAVAALILTLPAFR